MRILGEIKKLCAVQTWSMALSMTARLIRRLGEQGNRM